MVSISPKLREQSHGELDHTDPRAPTLRARTVAGGLCAVGDQAGIEQACAMHSDGGHGGGVTT